jgi:hypothetical protein
MKKPILLLSLVLGGLGCFGSDPDENSQIFNPNPGTTGTGGSGTGGSGTGTGGMGTNVTGPIVGTPLATFDTSVNGFALNDYHDTGGNKNLADAMAPASPPPTLSLDTSAGNPTPGMLKVTATYSGPRQYVDLQNKMFMSMPQNWTGGTLHVRIKVASGNYGGGAQVYALTGNFIFGGTYTNVAMGSNWQEFTVNLDSPMHPDPGYDPSKVIIFGVQLNNGDMGTAGEVTFNIDSFSIAGVAGGTGGTGGGTAGAGGGGAGAGGRGGSGGSGGAGGTTGSGGAGGSGDASVGN